PYFPARQIIDPGCAGAVHEVEALIGGHENRSRAHHAHCRLLSIPSIPPTPPPGDSRRSAQCMPPRQGERPAASSHLRSSSEARALELYQPPVGIGAQLGGERV